MNAYQKATLLVSVVVLPLVLLFMSAMEYRGTVAIGAAGLGATAGLVYSLRTKPPLVRPANRESKP